MAAAPFVSLYRRYRPGRFSELRGQDHVVRALQSAVRDGRVSHAYLFSGPRGTGKTSSARILAKALNCEAPVDGEPCGVCTSCTEITAGSSMDVHELDAASNNGVDAMRDLVAHAGLGTPGRWKIYIVDEVHMLSTAAANALLKTLEEPPAHVVFVLATTDPQKVPPTIRSRTQHLEFRLLGAETLTGLLESVNDSAGLGLDETAVSAAVRRARGSARDALSALDQVVAAGSSEAARPELSQVIDPLAAGSAPDVLVAVSDPALGRLGGAAAGHRAHRRPAPGVPGRAGARPVRRGGGRAGPLHGVGGGDGAAEGRAQYRDPGAGPDRHARGARRPGGVGDRAGARRASRSGLGDGGACRSGWRCSSGRWPGRRRFPGPGSGSPEGSGVGGGAEAGGRPAVAAAPGPAAAASVSAPASASPAEPESAAEVGKRPSLGALKRSKAAAAAAAPAPPVAGTGRGRGRRGGRTVAGGAAGRIRPARLPLPTVDRDSLTEAWGDSILKGLPARAKALYSAGRFVSVDADGGAHFALPNAAHRDRCAEMTATVEGKLREHFGTPVRLVLDVDDDGGPSGGGDSGSGDGGSGGGPGASPSAASASVQSGAPATSLGQRRPGLRARGRLRPGGLRRAGAGSRRPGQGGRGPPAPGLPRRQRGGGLTMYTGPLRSLIDELGRLPGIGPKSAQRIAFHMLKVPSDEARRLSDAIIAVKERTTPARRLLQRGRVGRALLGVQ